MYSVTVCVRRTPNPKVRIKTKTAVRTQTAAINDTNHDPRKIIITGKIPPPRYKTKQGFRSKIDGTRSTNGKRRTGKIGTPL